MTLNIGLHLIQRNYCFIDTSRKVVYDKHPSNHLYCSFYGIQNRFLNIIHSDTRTMYAPLMFPVQDQQRFNINIHYDTSFQELDD